MCEPSNKRVKPVAKGTGLAGLMAPVKTPSLKRLSQTIQRSISFRTESQPQQMVPLRARSKASSFPRRRNSQLWSEMVDSLSQDLSAREIKRQEVIYELTQGEKQLIEDLNLVQKVYYEPMLKLDIMTESELGQIFGTLDTLIPLHEDFLNRLENLRGLEKTVGEVGPTLLDWFPCLEAYITYCCNQVGAKALLDQKKQDRRVQHFLQLCQESSFSRRLDLWNFLDLPRSRLVKYPLLLKEIQKCTPPEHPDQDTLPEAMEMIQRIVSEVNSKTGEAECQFYRRGLSYPEEGQRLPEIQLSRFLYCHGELKHHKGHNCFRVSSRGRTKVQSHSLQANDSFNKQQWISCLRQAIVQSRDREAQTAQSMVSRQTSPDPGLCHIAELSLDSDVEMSDTFDPHGGVLESCTGDPSSSVPLHRSLSTPTLDSRGPNRQTLKAKERLPSIPAMAPTLTSPLSLREKRAQGVLICGTEVTHLPVVMYLHSFSLRIFRMLRTRCKDSRGSTRTTKRD
ncbi:rho guanine nucleotide exchange factor 3-like [Scleropages formosus]|uniref:Rho guanine nucleotide exchange factor 3-like n=1 Tax=Scleropages formosus TaxID=113540 RepID=A0A0P7UQJ0_SCLFO|nr:rho guanine nucleotide exchange factor 3-like [Scleropages formosus]